MLVPLRFKSTTSDISRHLRKYNSKKKDKGVDFVLEKENVLKKNILAF